MASLTFEVDYTAEASVVTAADKLAAIRRYAERDYEETRDQCWPMLDKSVVRAICDGDPKAMTQWSAPQITES